jgi:hypothetical protein
VDGEEPRPRPEGAPPLRLSEEVFSETPAPVVEDEVDVEAVEVEPGVLEEEAGAADDSETGAAAEEPVAETEPESQPEPKKAAELQPTRAAAEPEADAAPDEPEAEAASDEPEADS